MATNMSNVEQKQKDFIKERPTLIVPIDYKRKSSKMPENYMDVSSICDKQEEEEIEKKEDLNQQNNMIEDASKEEVVVENNETLILTRKSRCWFFVLILTINYCVNLENGTIPAATDKIQQDLKVSEADLGLFGSLLYIGNIIASIITMYIINKMNRKYIFIFCLITNGACLFLFTITRNVTVLFIIRIFTGVFQVFIIIYCPVWVDQFGSRHRKTLMMSLLQVTGPVGIVSGYAMTALFINNDLGWKASFQVQAAIYALLGVFLFFMPNIYFSSNLHNTATTENSDEANKNKPEAPNMVNQSSIRNENDNTQIKDKEKDKENKEKEKDEISVFKYKKENDSEANGFWKNLCILLKMRIYMLCVAANSILLFISTIIQFWTSDYLKKVLVVDESSVLIAFVLTCITAPTLGILVGGIIVQKFGGYEAKNSMTICCIYGLCAFLCSIPITQFSSLYGFAVFLWLFLFFGGCIVPNLIGITLSSLPNELRAAGSSSTNFFNNLIGFIPAPYFYGIIYDSTKKHSPRFAYGFSLIYSVSVVVLLCIANVYWRRKFNKKIQDDVEMEVVVEENKEKAEMNANSQRNRQNRRDSLNKENSVVGMEYIELELQNDDTKNKSENVINFNTNNNSPIIDRLDDNDVMKSCLSMKQQKGNFSNRSPEIAKFHSDGFSLVRKFNTNGISKTEVRKENIMFKGENGNQQVFEIKLENEESKEDISGDMFVKSKTLKN